VDGKVARREEAQGGGEGAERGRVVQPSQAVESKGRQNGRQNECFK